MTTIIASTVRKGGVGKTTTAIHLAAGAARMGKRTLLVDFDHQGQCCVGLGIEPYPGVFDLLVAHDTKATIHATGRQTGLLDILGGNGRTKTVETVAAAERWSLNQIALRLAAICNSYDVVVIDTHPSGWMQELAIVLANLTIIPVALDYLATSKVGETVQLVKELSSDINYRILPTMGDHTNEAKANGGELRDAYGTAVLPAIPRRVKLREAPSYGLTVYEHAPADDSAVAYMALCERLFGEGDNG